MPRRIPIAERFWSKVDKTDGCWLWSGGLDSGRKYGILSVHGRSVRAHRLSYEMHKGLIPDGLCVMHSCDVPACVNPAHLSVGTLADNCRDRTSKGRQAMGVRMGTAKLNERLVVQIRERRAAGESQYSLSREFGVSRQAVDQAVHRHTWKHVA